MSPRYFTPDLFAFLRDLADHNDRAWFHANQERYETVVRQPALDFIENLAEPLLAVSPHLVADPRKVGGSLFRIQRDTRFAHDKTPYKTHVGIHFRHVATREDVHAPGFYLHLEPRRSQAWLGLWHPAPERAHAIRQAIAADPVAWKRAAYGKRFTGVYTGLSGDSLARPPRGFDPGHPLIADLQRIDFGAGTPLRQAEVTSAHFLDTYLDTVRAGVPLMRFLCRALNLQF